MFKIERQAYIENELKKNKSVLISDLCQALDCSMETIRRDLKELEAAGKAQRIYGGAFLPEENDLGVPAKLRETFFPMEKRQMAEHALSFISKGDVIMLDASTTCLKLSQAILEADLPITIITNSLRICYIFNEQPNAAPRIICLGGELHAKTNSFIGYKTTNELNEYIADKSFISCPAIDMTFGLTDNNLASAMVRKGMIDHSRKRFLIADHTKFSSNASVLIAGLSVVDTIITDKPLPPTWEAECINKKIHLEYL
ncbi:MAG: DeoR/GlpR family DNA-binding transcription regulator [Hungatella sp.]|jgi:DeoR/GlpR family transcriptional regulator of sugar metabolism|nr:DeoR/GlpR family DNA-binding transcription regulator [Hungatella sp.]